MAGQVFWKALTLGVLCMLKPGCCAQAETMAEIQTEAAEVQNYEKLYRPVTDAIYQYLFEFSDENDSSEFGQLADVFRYAQERIDGLKTVGYAIQDISGDGVPELLIGRITTGEEVSDNDWLYAVYTWQDNEPKLVENGAVERVEMTPFIDYDKYAVRLTERNNNPEEKERGSTAECVVLHEGDYAAKYTLSCREQVTDVKIFRLSLEELTDGGEAKYASEEMYARREMAPNDSVTIQMELPELFPVCGISYEDTAGAHQLAVFESGRDGLVYLDEVSF